MYEMQKPRQIQTLKEARPILGGVVNAIVIIASPNLPSRFFDRFIHRLGGYARK
jgi:hypothetical protein